MLVKPHTLLSCKLYDRWATLNVHLWSQQIYPEAKNRHPSWFALGVGRSSPLTSSSSPCWRRLCWLPTLALFSRRCPCGHICFVYSSTCLYGWGQDLLIALWLEHCHLSSGQKPQIWDSWHWCLDRPVWKLSCQRTHHLAEALAVDQ